MRVDCAISRIHYTLGNFQPSYHTLRFSGPPQSTPFENTPLHPYPEGHLVNGRLEGSQSPASPHLAAARRNTAHCHQQEQEDGTTASDRPATLNTDELNSPTYRTWSSSHVASSGHPVEVRGLQAVHPVGESGLVGRGEEVAQLRRDVRKAVKQEMRTIVRELMKVSECNVDTYLHRRHSVQSMLHYFPNVECIRI